MTLTERIARLSKFDRVVGGVCLALAGLIALTIVLGDRVGVLVYRAAPLGEGARSTSRITLEFSEPMQRESVEPLFSTQPALTGAVSWSGNTFVFQPDEPVPPGTTVNVRLLPGAQAQSGRVVLSEYRFDFSVRVPRIAFLFPANGTPQNIWVADTAGGEPTQLTFSPSGIYDFAVSPDGSQIVFSENNSNNGTRDLKLLNLESGALEQITNCADSLCNAPVWRPDGAQIAYERVELNSDLAQQGVGSSPTRIWTLDLTSRPVQTRPLFSDLQLLGHSPQYSGNGERIAMYDSGMGAILVNDLRDGSLTAIPTRSGTSGALSPDGSQLAYTEIVLADDAIANSYLRIANLVSNDVTNITDPPAATSDQRVAWRPDGRMMAVARRDESLIRGYQIYMVDPLTGEAQQVTTDGRYTNMFFAWDPTGRYLAVHRFPELDEFGQPNMNGLPEIWMLDTQTLEMTMLAVNGFLPRWMP
jgi:Tol biopolymer transport system component